mgnify:CR=1 FL=1
MFLCLEDSNPDGFILFSRFADAFHQAMQPDTGIHHHTLHLVLAHQDAALGIIGVVAGMDADALEIRNTLQIRQPLLETGRLGDEQRIGAFGNRRTALHLLRLLARNPAQAHVHLLGLEFHALGFRATLLFVNITQGDALG